MNTTPYMDKQIMDLSQGSPETQSKDFIDLMKHPEEEEEEVDHNTHHTLQIAGARMDGIDKKEEILANYDFQPIRPVGVVVPPSRSPNFDATPVLAGRAWSSASDPKLNTTTVAAATATRNYGSLYSEPAKVILEKDHDAFSSPIVSEIDRTMKKYVDNLLHVLEGVSARITQLESRTRNLESSIDNLKVSFGNNHGSTDGRLRQLENILREVQTGVQGLKDKQLVLGGEPGLAKLQTTEAEQQPETQNTVQVGSVQQAASVPQQSQQHLPSANNQQALPALPPPDAPPQPSPPPNLPPSFQFPPQFLQNQIPSIPQHEPYFPPPGQTPEAPNQQYQSSLTQQSYPPPAAPPHQQFQPGPQQQFSQPPPQLPQQRPSLPPANPPQLQPSLSHHAEEVPYAPQNYPPSLRQPPSGPNPSQQFYGAPSHMYESPSSRSSSGFSSGYGPPSGPTESYHYGGSPQYGGTSTVKPPLSSAVAQSGGTGYPQLPTARVLPQALPTASGVSSDSGSTGTGNRVPVDDVVDKVTSMGFPRDHVRATVRKLTENGQSVDLNVVLDKLMNEGEVQPPRGWFGR
ncbi:hypothetical protein I3843_03G038500 [Carya illinoinensis]|uniref:DUF1421 domain-containing protein n=1 Tax=Carya illinoinensis TaxID=32201 RepID=A0A922JWQ7_CARIL|nr:hypothetical protein I3842_03G037000 [Carya illinoinensis]KAG7985670.1 hypothetical protein I3843_03G038500 [Carya illinoinensis]